MGSNLYISIDTQFPNGHWAALFDGPSRALDRHIIIIRAFGNADPEDGEPTTDYLPKAEWQEMAKHPECPWQLDEPYWVRCISGQEFVDIIQEKRWQTLQDGDFRDEECSPYLRAFAALVGSLLNQGIPVRVYCWDSQ